MLMHLGALTLVTRMGPLVDVCIYPGPHVTSGDKALNGTNACVRQGMKHIKDSMLEQLEYIGAGCVTEQGNISSLERHRMELNGMNLLDWTDKGHPVVCELWQLSRWTWPSVMVCQ